MKNLEIKVFEEIDRNWARAFLSERWASSRVVTRGIVHEAHTLPGFVAIVDGVPNGLATYRISEGECELVTLDSLLEGCGVGTALLNAVRTVAREQKSCRLWLITTNDNLPAQRFYHKRGFKVAAIHKNAMEGSRRLKPEIPDKGYDGISIRDEIEMSISGCDI